MRTTCFSPLPVTLPPSHVGGQVGHDFAPFKTIEVHQPRPSNAVQVVGPAPPQVVDAAHRFDDLPAFAIVVRRALAAHADVHIVGRKAEDPTHFVEVFRALELERAPTNAVEMRQHPPTGREKDVVFRRAPEVNPERTEAAQHEKLRLQIRHGSERRLRVGRQVGVISWVWILRDGVVGGSTLAVHGSRPAPLPGGEEEHHQNQPKHASFFHFHPRLRFCPTGLSPGLRRRRRLGLNMDTLPLVMLRIHELPAGKYRKAVKQVDRGAAHVIAPRR